MRSAELRRMWPFAIGLTVAIGVLLIAGDHFFHVETGLLVHHWGPYLGQQSVWVIPMFLAAAAAMVTFALCLPMATPGRSPWANIIGSIAIVELAYALTGWLGHDHGILLGVVLLGSWILRLAWVANRAAVVACSILLALVGPLIEGLVSAAGLFDYANPDVIGVPWWLFALYLHGGFALVAIAQGAQRIRAKSGHQGASAPASA